jgi:hypothetical protein
MCGKAESIPHFIKGTAVKADLMRTWKRQTFHETSFVTHAFIEVGFSRRFRLHTLKKIPSIYYPQD